MPIRDVVERLLGRFRFSMLVTPVFQSDEDVGEGACRGFTSQWIGAHKLGVRQVVAYRDLAQTNQREFVRAGLAFHNSLTAVEREFKANAEEVRTLHARYEELRRARMPGTLASPEETRLEQEIPRASLRVQNGLKIIQSYRLGGITLDFTEKTVSFLILKCGAHRALGAGLHYVGCGKHCFGFFLQDEDSPCLFFDANSGEWRFSRGYDLDLFFLEYIDDAYGPEYNFLTSCTVVTTSGDTATLGVPSTLAA